MDNSEPEFFISMGSSSPLSCGGPQIFAGTLEAAMRLRQGQEVYRLGTLKRVTRVDVELVTN
jgi:hypothetical protein